MPAQIIDSFCELMPGVPWTEQLMIDMFEDLRVNDMLHFPVKTACGIARVNAYIGRTEQIGRRIKGRETATVATMSAWLLCYSTEQEEFPYTRKSESPMGVKKKEFPYTPQGFKEAVEHLQEATQWLTRRGFCSFCIAKEPPLKRIRLSTQPYCTRCLVETAIAPQA